MTNLSSYTPFLIGSGQARTGLFQYLESWVKPEDAFDTLEDAYVNRGQIWKREGQTLLGVLKYCTSQVLAYGVTATGAGPYTGNLSSTTPRNAHLPIVAGSITVRARENNGVADLTETFTSDNGTPVATLTGNNGGSGTVNIITGAWSLTGGDPINNSSPIMIDYSYIPTTASNAHKIVSVVGLGSNPASAGPYSGTAQEVPITPGSAFLTIFITGGVGTTTYLDDGVGNFRESLPAGTIRGTIDYITGAWTFTASANLSARSAIQLGFTPVATTQNTIMGITQWNDESNNTFDLVVCDTRRASVYNITSQEFDPICEVNETLFIVPETASPQSFDNGETATPGITPTFGLIAPLSITLTLINPVTGTLATGTATTTDDGAGGIIAAGYFAANSTVNYFTGEFILNMTDDGANLLTAGYAINAQFTLQNDYFTGDQSNFFNWTNWEPSTNRIVTQAASSIVAPATIAERPTQYQVGFLYLTNGVDPITLYHNGALSRPAFAIKQSNLGLGKNEILNALDVKTFASRLLIVRPTTTLSDGNPDPQSIRWSAQFQPTNTVADIPGSGGELSAATSDWIQSCKFLKDFIIVSFQNSRWTFRFTGSAFAPFQFFRYNATKTCNAPYGSIEYDDCVKDMGSKGLVLCDGNQAERYDLKIFDQFEDINSTSFKQCFGQRFDILNQAWMLYPDSTSNATTSTKVLLHNYIEDSWAVFNMPLSCLGLGFGIRDITWADLTSAWNTQMNAWNSYLEQKESLRLLGGDFQGQVLQLNDGPTDNGTAIVANILTKKYNPFAEQGLKGSFGYVDVYYTVNPAVTLTYKFFIDNNSNTPVLTENVTLTGTTGASYGWQRIFVNIQCTQIQWQITDNGVTNYNILGHILHAAPAGRITQ